jgi:hypothetical protein
MRAPLPGMYGPRPAFGVVPPSGKPGEALFHPQLTTPAVRPGAPIPAGAWPPSVNGVSSAGGSHEGASSMPPNVTGMQMPQMVGRPPVPMSFQGPSGFAGSVRPSPSPVGGPLIQVNSNFNFIFTCNI